MTRIETLYREGDALRASNLPAAISRPATLGSCPEVQT